jgi:ferritin-like metal-binding protein YciE
MKLFNKTKFDTLDDLLVEQIEDLYDAEQRLTDTLPKMAEAASNSQLATAFRTHLEETRQHVNRLENVFQLLGKEPSRETCDAMKGLISEGEDMIDAEGSPEIRDAALIAAAQRVEHYEIAGYGSARTFASRVGRDDVAAILQQTLDEEKAADKKLTQIAESSVNPSAARARP